jgi:hypothetical protein
MLRFSIFTAIFLTGAFATLIWNLQPDPSANIPTGAAPSAEEVQAMMTSYSCFKHTLVTTLHELIDGKIHLEAARNRVHDSAKLHFPDYLKHIEIAEHGSNHQTRIARNLIGHLRGIDNGSITLQHRVLALEVEFAALQHREMLSVGTRVLR